MPTVLKCHCQKGINKFLIEYQFSKQKSFLSTFLHTFMIYNVIIYKLIKYCIDDVENVFNFFLRGFNKQGYQCSCEYSMNYRLQNFVFSNGKIDFLIF